MSPDSCSLLECPQKSDSLTECFFIIYLQSPLDSYAEDGPLNRIKLDVLTWPVQRKHSIKLSPRISKSTIDYQNFCGVDFKETR